MDSESQGRGQISVPLIGLSGYAQAGKDTTAAVLIERAGFIRVSFADALRDAIYALNPQISDWSGTARLQELVDAEGWDYVKVTYPEVRRLLQAMGTEVGRAQFGENFWVETAFRKMSGNTVFTDVRFPNEYEAIKAAGGEVWRITRKGTGPVNGHPSETALDDFSFDRVIENDGSLDDLAKVVLGG
jgi:hypothetical protein